MHSSVLEQIEDMIELLSSEEQLWLIEQLAHRLQKEPAKSDEPTQSTFENQLAAMAADPEVQAELRKIDKMVFGTDRCFLLNAPKTP